MQLERVGKKWRLTMSWLTRGPQCCPYLQHTSCNVQPEKGKEIVPDHVMAYKSSKVLPLIATHLRHCTARERGPEDEPNHVIADKRPQTQLIKALHLLLPAQGHVFEDEQVTASVLLIRRSSSKLFTSFCLHTGARV